MAVLLTFLPVNMFRPFLNPRALFPVSSTRRIIFPVLLLSRCVPVPPSCLSSAVHVFRTLTPNSPVSIGSTTFWRGVLSCIVFAQHGRPPPLPFVVP
ncbi:hypothetical protein FB451DRAFT_1396595 [Mycena latifolia]|nr:hypothetical protein FB451DRAFT_1396595 [Mycena latifolia]